MPEATSNLGFLVHPEQCWFVSRSRPPELIVQWQAPFGVLVLHRIAGAGGGLGSVLVHPWANGGPRGASEGSLIL